MGEESFLYATCRPDLIHINLHKTILNANSVIARTKIYTDKQKDGRVDSAMLQISEVPTLLQSEMFCRNYCWLP